MATFYLHFSDGRQTFPSDLSIDFADLDQAYLEVCLAVPAMAQDLLIKRQDPMAASFAIADAKGHVLMTVPFTDVLSGSEWRSAQARQRSHASPRSTHARYDLALTSFRRMFNSVNAACVLLTPELQVVEVNDFGARQSKLDNEAIRGKSIVEIFAELRGKAKANFGKFLCLLKTRVESLVEELPYTVLDADGQITNGWWNLRAWPVFDDDNSLLGFIVWAESHAKPTREGKRNVRSAKTVPS